MVMELAEGLRFLYRACLGAKENSAERLARPG